MSLFERVHLPSFAGATEWLNSEPLGTAGLDLLTGRSTLFFNPLAAVPTTTAS